MNLKQSKANFMKHYASWQSRGRLEEGRSKERELFREQGKKFEPFELWIISLHDILRNFPDLDDLLELANEHSRIKEEDKEVAKDIVVEQLGGLRAHTLLTPKKVRMFSHAASALSYRYRGDHNHVLYVFYEAASNLSMLFAQEFLWDEE